MRSSTQTSTDEPEIGFTRRVLRIDAHDVGMIHAGSDLFLAFETIEEHEILLDHRVWNLDGHGASIGEVGGAEDGDHPGRGDQRVDAIVTRFLSGLDVGKRRH